jgi:hypothetical protein
LIKKKKKKKKKMEQIDDEVILDYYNNNLIEYMIPYENEQELYYDAEGVLTCFLKSKRQVKQQVDMFEKHANKKIILDQYVFINEYDIAECLLDAVKRKKIDFKKVEDFITTFLEHDMPEKTPQHQRVNDKEWDNLVKKRHQKKQKEKNNVDEKIQLTMEEIKLQCIVLESLSKTYEKVNSQPLRQKLLISINNIERTLEACLPIPPLYIKDDSKIIRVSKRIKELRPHVSQETIRKHRLEIGEIASDLHFQHYGIKPPQFLGWANGQKRPINRYTKLTAPRTLDMAIEIVFPN